MNMVVRSPDFNQYCTCSLDDATDILVDSREIVSEHGCAVRFRVENDMYNIIDVCICHIRLVFCRP